MNRVLAAAFVLAMGQAPSLPAPAARTIDFTRDIKPILQNSCVKCHGRGRAKGGFSLETREAMLEGGDCHLYLNHLEQVDEQLARKPYPLPTLVIKRKPPTLFDYVYEDFEIANYQSHPAIKAPVAV